VLAARTADRYCDGTIEWLWRPPRSSFGHGAAGIAYFLARYGSVAGDTAALDHAARWAARAEGELTLPGFAGDPPVFPNRRAVPPSSVLFGEAGVWWAGALVHHAVGDAAGVDRATSRFCGLAASCPDDAVDVAWGAAGLLLAAAVLVEGGIGGRRALAAGEGLARRLDDGVSRRTTSVAWLGAAHGWCGIAHALLRWCQATGASPSPALTGLLASLRQTRLPRGVWPRRHGSTEVWPGWCHGSAGWAQLWTVAGQVLDDAELLALTEPAAVLAILQPGGGASLCCGLAGRAYAALSLFQSTGEPTWLAHGRRLAEEARQVRTGPDFPEHSLWGGDVGVALLAMELEVPERAAMPVFGPRR
jgi:hypothetical protein